MVVAVPWFLIIRALLILNGCEIIKGKWLPFKTTQSSFSSPTYSALARDPMKSSPPQKLPSSQASWSPEHRGQGHPHCCRSPPAFTVGCCGLSRKVAWFRATFFFRVASEDEAFQGTKCFCEAKQSMWIRVQLPVLRFSAYRPLRGILWTRVVLFFLCLCPCLPFLLLSFNDAHLLDFSYPLSLDF